MAGIREMLSNKSYKFQFILEKPPSLDNVVKLILILILLTAVDFSAATML